MESAISRLKLEHHPSKGDSSGYVSLLEALEGPYSFNDFGGDWNFGGGANGPTCALQLELVFSAMPGKATRLKLQISVS